MVINFHSALGDHGRRLSSRPSLQWRSHVEVIHLWWRTRSFVPGARLGISLSGHQSLVAISIIRSCRRAVLAICRARIFYFGHRSDASRATFVRRDWQEDLTKMEYNIKCNQSIDTTFRNASSYLLLAARSWEMLQLCTAALDITFAGTDEAAYGNGSWVSAAAPAASAGASADPQLLPQLLPSCCPAASAAAVAAAAPAVPAAALAAAASAAAPCCCCWCSLSPQLPILLGY